MPHATFDVCDLTKFCRLDELGLVATGQRLEPRRAVPTNLTELAGLGRTLTRRAADVLAYVEPARHLDRPRPPTICARAASPWG